tara:strand:- start:392 stop:574 length:183 start_codon:yes stop_codon:yes gene_type:complete
MLTGYWLIVTIVLLAATAINVTLSLRMLRTLTVLSDLSLAAIRVQQRDGQDKPTESGGLE